MAKTELKAGIRFRWWVIPLAYASIVPAGVIGLFLGAPRGDAFVASVRRFVFAHGVKVEID